MPITGFWKPITQYQIRGTQKVTRRWTKRCRKGNCTEWPTSTTIWRCGKATRTYVLHRRNLALKTNRWPPLDKFRTWKRSSKPPGHHFNMMVRLRSNCQKDHLCHQLCLQWWSLEDELKWLLCAESGESTVILSNVVRKAHLKACRTPNIG